MTIVSVNVGEARTVEWQGRPVTSAIWKQWVVGPVRIAGVNLAGDDQADRRVHGGPDKAVYAYAVEDYEWWASDLGPLAPGTFGENLTTQGVDVTNAGVGDRWRIGSAVLEVAQPRQPCFKLGMRMNDEHFPGVFERAQRPGAYLRVIEEGDVRAGDAVIIERGAPPRITMAALVAPAPSDAFLHTVIDDPRVADSTRRWARHQLANL